MNDSSSNEQEPREGDPTADVRHTESVSRRPFVWPLALVVAATLAFLAMNYAPKPYVVPEKVAQISMNSSQEAQREAAETTLHVHWQNSLIALGLAGACIGLSSVFVVPWQTTGRAVLSVVGCLVVGAVCGILAVVLAFLLREQFSAGGSLASLATDEESLLPDLTVWVLMSVLLALPTAFALLAGGERMLSQKVMAVPLAGFLTGLLVPIGISLLLPGERTSDIPPQGLLVTGVWMVALAIFLLLLTTFTGARTPKSREASVATETPA